MGFGALGADVGHSGSVLEPLREGAVIPLAWDRPFRPFLAASSAYT